MRTIAPEENCPPVRFAIWVKVSFKVGGNQTTASEENSPPARVRVRVSFGVRGQFSAGVIVLEPFLRNHFHAVKL